MIQGDYAYVIDKNSHDLKIIDLNTFTFLSNIIIGPNAYSLEVKGDYAYVVDDDDNDLRIIDISNKTTPTLITTLSFGATNAGEVRVQGDYAYVLDWGTDDIKVIDVSDPATPSILSNLVIGSSPRSLVVKGDYAYIIDEISDDLKIVNISNPNALTLTSSLTIGDTPYAIAKKDNFIYVADQTDNDIKVIDVSDPMNPILITSHGVGDTPVAIIIRDNYAYLVDEGSDDLKVIDISDPNNLSTVDNNTAGSLPRDVGVRGNFAYAIDNGANNIRKIKLSNPQPVNLDANGDFFLATAAPVWNQTTSTVYTNEKVGIGTSTISPANSFIDLDVADGHITVQNGFGIFSTNSSNNSLASGFDTDNENFLIYAGGSIKMQVLADGKVGIGRIPATNMLEVEGSASKTTAGNWLANSDARLKKNIQSLDCELMLEKLLSLQGITYEWNDTQTGTQRPLGIQYGFTAQNIQQVFPEFVKKDGHGFLQTAYGTYDAMQVEMIRALNDKIEALENGNQDLKKDLEELNNLIFGTAKK